jgi:hypothetical protein
MEYENILFVSRTNKGQQVSGGFTKGQTNLGVKTDKKVKRVGCSNLKDLIESGKLIIQDPDTISEFGSFIQRKDSFAADDGYNDDLAMTHVLFGWFASNPSFRDFSDVDLRKAIHEKRIQMIDEETLPVGYFNDGETEPEPPLNF